MKATGIVRRIDDLGRAVIPKEIRRTMRLRDGEGFVIHLLGFAFIFQSARNKSESSYVPGFSHRF